MTRPEEPKIAGFRADYANDADFCKVLEQELKPLYLLAFLMTANHEKAERCFVTTAEQVLSEPVVFESWARSWTKRCMIKNAIAMVSPTSDDSNEKRDLWRAGQHKARGDDEIDMVTRIQPLERFVFVMSILERYSDQECALLIGCTRRSVAKARTRALRRLQGPVGLVPTGEPRASRYVELPSGSANADRISAPVDLRLRLASAIYPVSSY
jgi:DNA-directed RNA polymerase specialized sigma24 family protein